MLVKLFGNLRLHGAGKSPEVVLPPVTTVRGVLEALFAEHPALREHILQPDGSALLPHVNIMVNGRLIRDLQGLETPVKEGDAFAVFPPSAGG